MEGMTRTRLVVTLIGLAVQTTNLRDCMSEAVGGPAPNAAAALPAKSD